MLVAIVVLREHTDTLVYIQDPNGHLYYAGVAGKDESPTSTAIKDQIAVWATAMRDIPGDPTLVDRNSHVILDTTATGSDAFSQFQQFYGTDANPKLLSTHGYTRAVTSVEVNSQTDKVYYVAITEQLSQNHEALGPPQTWKGTVTLLTANPTLPTDPDIARYNPPGIAIASYDIPWANPKP